MKADIATVAGSAVLGTIILVFGVLGLRHLDPLVGTQGGPDLIEHRRGVVRRGAIACLVAGSVVVLGAVALGVRRWLL